MPRISSRKFHLAAQFTHVAAQADEQDELQAHQGSADGENGDQFLSFKVADGVTQVLEP